jgi:hypothetical protein
MLYHNNGDGHLYRRHLELSYSKHPAGQPAPDFSTTTMTAASIWSSGRYMEWDFSAGGIFAGVDKARRAFHCHPDESSPHPITCSIQQLRRNFQRCERYERYCGGKGKSLGSPFGDYNNDGPRGFIHCQ